MKKNIAIIAGGDSGEFEISILSANNVMTALDKKKYNLYLIITHKGKWNCTINNKSYEIDKTDFSLSIENKKIKFAAVFIIIHGTPGENGLLQGYFDMIGIKYTGCSALVSALTFDKAFCNEVVRNFNVVSVAKNIASLRHNPVDLQTIIKEIGLPLFVKPSQGGSSLATFKVNSEKELAYAINKAFEVDNKVLIEQFIKGRELTCGVFNDITLPVTEIVTDREFFDYEAKYNGMSKEITPAKIPDTLKQKVQIAAKEIYLQLGCNGVCRIDFIYNEETDKLFFLEINTVPGQSPQSIIPQQVRAMGKTPSWLYNEILQEVL
ncbi:MAG: D-alanine--D-alanine ligase [Bacteroidales bacterium]|jgi:D-alanine-D-alanine ligase|nr:D-alanine--D-alanine ligase [Bacteroidales bacterium]